MKYYQRTIINSTSNKVLLVLVIAGIFFIGLATFILESFRHDSFVKQYEVRATSQVDFQRQTIIKHFNTYRRDAVFLSLAPSVQGLIRVEQNSGVDPLGVNTALAWQQRLGSTLSGFLNANSYVVRSVLIDLKNDGQEIIRVERRGDEITIVSSEELKKGNRENHLLAMQGVSKGEVYLSDMKLEKNKGFVSVPHLPTLDISTPIFNNAENRFGYLIITVDARHLLSAISATLDSEFDAYLTNSAGGFLLHPNPKMTFGFEQGKPIHWNHLFEPLTPGAEFEKKYTTDSKRTAFYGIADKIFLTEGKNERFLTLTAAVDESYILRNIKESRVELILFSFLAYFVVALIAFLIYLGIKEHIKANTEHTKLAAIVDFSNDAIISLTLKGKITSWNRAAELMFGFSAKEVIDESVFDFIFPESIIEEEKLNFSKISKGESIPNYNTIRKKKDGTLFQVSETASPIISIDNDVYGSAKIIRNISEQKRIESEIHRLNLSLEQKISQRTNELSIAKVKAEFANRAKSEFIANMSHEIRTPMNAVIGLLQLLQRTKPTPIQLDYAKKAESAAGALLEIINDILDFSKVEAGKLHLDPHPFCLSSMLRGIGVIMANNLGNKNIDLLFDSYPGIPDKLIGDSTRLQQVLINLASNAIKYTSQGEIILSIVIEENDGHWMTLGFKISDTGIGISKEYQENIFTGFSQAEASTSRHYGGTGLGLAISQRLVELMGGNLELDSELGHGSVFQFSVKLEIQNSQDSSKSNINYDNIENLKILLVDDNASALNNIGAMLRGFKWQVTECSSVTEAIEKIEGDKTQSHLYDMIIIDGQIHDVTLWHETQEIRDLLSSPAAPGIVFTAASGNNLLNHNEDTAPDNSILIKPITRSVLFDAVMQVYLSHQNKSVKNPPATNSHAQNIGPLRSTRILLVEDNHNNQIVASELLKGEGATVKIAGGGQEAIDILKKGADQFDIILMDIQMPNLDGYETTYEIRHALNLLDLPIIAVTANILPSDKIAALNAGMLDHVGKPFKLKNLTDVILKHKKPTENITESGEAATSPTEENGNNSKNISSFSTTSGEPLIPTAALDLATSINIDVAGAVLRFSGKISLYQDLLIEFCNEVFPLLKQGKNHLNEGEFEHARRDYHTLKGHFATMGFDTFAAHAAELETQLRNGTENIDLNLADKLLIEFERIKPKITILEELLGCESKEKPKDIKNNNELSPAEAIEQDNSTEDKKKLLVELENLSALLESKNLEATSLFEHLKINKVYSENFESETLAKAIDSLDFRTALLSCHDLLTEIRSAS